MQAELSVELKVEGETAFAGRLLDLPISPFPGLVLDGVSDNPEVVVGVVGVSWNVRDDTWLVECEAIFDPADPAGGTIEEQFESLGAGWFWPAAWQSSPSPFA